MNSDHKTTSQILTMKTTSKNRGCIKPKPNPDPDVPSGLPDSGGPDRKGYHIRRARGRPKTTGIATLNQKWRVCGCGVLARLSGAVQCTNRTWAATGWCGRDGAGRGGGGCLPTCFLSQSCRKSCVRREKALFFSFIFCVFLFINSLLDRHSSDLQFKYINSAFHRHLWYTGIKPSSSWLLKKTG